MMQSASPLSESSGRARAMNGKNGDVDGEIGTSCTDHPSDSNLIFRALIEVQRRPCCAFRDARFDSRDQELSDLYAPPSLPPATRTLTPHALRPPLQAKWLRRSKVINKARRTGKWR